MLAIVFVKGMKGEVGEEKEIKRKLVNEWVDM